MAAISKTCRIRNPAVFICDMQEKFEAAIFEFPKIASTATKLLRATKTLSIPTFITTQNRLRLGPTIPKITEHLKGPNVRADIDKTLFSMITPEIDALLPKPSKGEQPYDAILVGIETHICITQTTLDLLERGHRVYILVDGVSSINPEERGIALARLRDAGAIVTTSESILFEIIGDAGHKDFKAVTGLVKETKAETKEALEKLAKI
ncbi:putative isochorismatase family hydrolase [Aspergillus stella-maris]|uniref:putative isochorismatase family hydrolase n=1 Tax=Aspergillus stella-maris TaxID=1810926 RepID=UPI003CCD2C5E